MLVVEGTRLVAQLVLRPSPYPRFASSRMLRGTSSAALSSERQILHVPNLSHEEEWVVVAA